MQNFDAQSMRALRLALIARDQWIHAIYPQMCPERTAALEDAIHLANECGIDYCELTEE